MKSLDRYMARLVALPLLANLVIAAMLLVLDRIRILLDFVATEGGPVSVVWKMLANLLPEYLGLGIPIGLLLGVLFAFRRLATSSELDVMRAVGISYGRLLRVPFLFAVLLAALNFAIVGFLQPYSRFHYEQLRFELRTGALGASIKVGEFAHFGDKMTIRIEKSADEGRKLTGIFVEAKNKNGSSYAVNAESGQFMATDNPDEIVFRLSNGTLINQAPGMAVPRVLTFTSHSLPISLPKYENFRKRGGADMERTLPELARFGHDPAATAEQRDGSRAEFHFRMVEVVSMFLLPLLGLALGVPPKRSTSVLGVFLSIVMIVTYHKVNQYMASLAGLGRLDPLIALWGPFLVFAGLVIWMYYTIAYVPGGQPIGGLERVFDKLGKLVRRYLPKRRAARIRDAQPA
jgi:lipopolysaccharide export system permease protein